MLYIWLAVIAALILVEILSRNFTAACFIVSAIASSICTVYKADYTLEVGLFLIIGVLLLIFVRPNVMEYINNRFKKKDKKEEEKVTEIKEKKEDTKKVTSKKTKTKKSVKK